MIRNIMRIITLLIWGILIISQLAYSQKQNYNWIFGRNCYINFDNVNLEPKNVEKSALDQWEGVATISDKDGNLLFYSNGETVWNRKHNVMNNGSGLLGYYSSAQSCIALQKPGSNNLYYLFTIDGIERINNGLNYSIIDMNEDNGFGKVINKNVKKLAPSIERLTAIVHANKKDYWIISHQHLLNRYNVFLLDEDSLHTTPIISYGKEKTGHGSWACLVKASHDGKLVASANLKTKEIEVFDFDKSSGILTLKHSIPFEGYDWAYGFEFSPDDKLLYVSAHYPCQVVQYNLSLNSNNNITNSKVVLATITGHVFYYGSMQLAPNGKIYVAQDGSNHLAVINNPSAIGQNCNFDGNGFDVSSVGLSRLGLPNFVNNLPDNNLCNAKGSNLIINPYFENDSIEFESNYTLTKDVDNFQNNQATIIISDSNPTLFKNDCELIDGRNERLFIHTKQNESLKLMFNKDILPNKIYLISFNFIKLNQNNNHNFEIVINGENLDVNYNVNTGDCKIDTIQFEYFSSTNNKLNLDINFLNTREDFFALDDFVIKTCDCDEFQSLSKNYEVCKNQDIKLNGRDSSSFVNQWLPQNLFSNPDSFEQILKSDKDVTIYLQSMNIQSNCYYYDTFNIKIAKPQEIEILGDNFICKGDSIFLTISDDYKTYNWSNGTSSKGIYVSQAGSYRIDCIDENGCEYFGEIDIYFYQVPATIILGPDAVCENEQYTLSLKNEAVQYNWSNGERTKAINCNGPGTYIVECIYEHGCKSYDTITINQKEQYVNIAELSYDLGDLCPYATKQFDFKIVSRSPSESTISQIQFSNQNGIFTFEDNKPLPIIINNGDNLYRINLFALEQRGRHYDTLNIVIKEECENTYQVVLSWNIVDSDTKVWLQDTLVSAGDYVCYPIYFESSCKSDQDIFETYTLELDVNKKLFMPDKVDFGTFTVSKIDDEMNRITITASHNLKNQNGVINHICGRVLLSDSIDNKAIINSFKFDNYDISTNVIKNGNIKLTQCQFGIRHIDLIKVTNFSISPNISDDYSKINLVSSEVGTFKFEVFDYTGNLVDTFYLKRANKSDSDELNYDIRLDNKTQGVYFIKLTAPWSTITKSMIVVR